MIFIQNLLCTIADVFLLADILLCTDLIKATDKKQNIAKNILCLIIFISFSIFFYNIGFNINKPLLKILLLVFFYVRFPIISAILIKKSFINCIYITFTLTQLSALAQSLIYSISNTFINFIQIDMYKNIITIILRGSIIIFLLSLKKKQILNKLIHLIKLIPTKIYILISINISLMGAITSVTQYETANLNAQIVSINVVLLLIFIISIIITVSLISNCISKTYYNSVNSILEKQIENQIEHYKQTEALNNDLRRFKHDYTNHILCLKSMIGADLNDEALEYIEKINSEISLSAKTFNTGHKIADAILNEKHRACSDIDINFDGCIPDFIDNVDLCIVLGNAVDNAVEACEKLNGTNKVIDITADFQQGHFILIIKNPVPDDLKIGGNLPETTKNDPLRHGFGLSNIKRIVDKYEGDMSVEAADGVFTLYIALKSDKEI